jgi:hypothetical protein
MVIVVKAAFQVGQNFSEKFSPGRVPTKKYKNGVKGDFIPLTPFCL